MVGSHIRFSSHKECQKLSLVLEKALFHLCLIISTVVLVEDLAFDQIIRSRFKIKMVMKYLGCVVRGHLMY